MLEKLYALYKAVLDESRFVKAVFAYLGITFLLHLFTSAKQTNGIRGLLYLGTWFSLHSGFFFIPVDLFRDLISSAIYGQVLVSHYCLRLQSVSLELMKQSVKYGLQDRLF